MNRRSSKLFETLTLESAPDWTNVNPWQTPTTQYRRHEGFWWAQPPQTKLQAPQIETWNTIDQWRFGQFLECHAPPHKRKAPLLKTFWRRFCYDLMIKHIPRKLCGPCMLIYNHGSNMLRYFTVKLFQILIKN